MNKALKYITFLGLGILFGITLTKGEVISWYRIQEMFRFQSFHMYGVIGTAVTLGVISTRILLWASAKDILGDTFKIKTIDKGFWRYLLGGSIFGLGWAFTGACPGPLYILVGNGEFVMGVAILSAILGTYAYGALRHRLPH